MKMRLLHVALACSSEATSDRFFEGVLGLTKTRTKTLSPNLAAPLFGLEQEYELVYYGDDDVQFEVFLSDRADLVAKHVGHVCLEVDDVEELVARCKAIGVEVRRVKRGDSFVTFVADEDGNQFELKEKA